MIHFTEKNMSRAACCTAYPGRKTLLARGVASQLDINFLKVVSNFIIDKYIGRIIIIGCNIIYHYAFQMSLLH